jgi:hypothetical protein
MIEGRCSTSIPSNSKSRGINTPRAQLPSGSMVWDPFGNNDKRTHHVVIFMLEDVAMVHVSPTERAKLHGDADHFSWIDSNHVFGTSYTGLESTCHTRSNRGDGFSAWINLGFTQDSIQLKWCLCQREHVHQMHMDRMRVWAGIDDKPNFAAVEMHTPVDPVIKFFCAFPEFLRRRRTS